MNIQCEVRVSLFATLIIFVSSARGQSTAPTHSGETDVAPSTQPERPGEREFGEVRGEPVENGFVCVNGKYVEAPYRVDRVGIDVTINDVLVRRWWLWPLPKPVTIDPPPPATMNPNMHFAEISDYLHLKGLYLYEKYPEAEAKQKFEDLIRSLPMFREVVKLKGSGYLRVILRDGATYTLLMGPPAPDSIIAGKGKPEMVLQDLNGDRRFLEESLKGGCAIFVMGGGKYVMSGHNTLRKLPLIIQVLGGDDTEANKVRVLQRLGVLPEIMLPHHFATVRDFRVSGQLKDRLNAAVKASGIRPMTVDEVPEVTPAEETRRKIREEYEKYKAKRATSSSGDAMGP